MPDIDWGGLFPGLEVLTDEPMKNHTTFRIGGSAKVILRPETTQEAAGILRVCSRRGLKPFFLGNGSNLLASDGGYDGVIVSTARMDCLMRMGDRSVYAGSGVLLSKLANYAAGLGLSGLEFAAGIPGSVGGAVRMNAGAYGGEMGKVVARADYLDPRGREGILETEGCQFAYRHSVFCWEPWLITGVLFHLTPGDPGEIRARMAELGKKRREKQPLEYPSAGSAFKRPPPVDGEPQYAAALIDGCQLKGLRVGDAQVSKKHAGFVVNLGEATAADVLALMDQVREEVKRQTGVTLEPEVEFLGEKEGV